MHKGSILSLLIFAILSLTSCSTYPTSALPSSFTTKNILKVHQGMSSDKILALFGEPKSIRSAVCGRAPDQWRCTTWKYGDSPYSNASFTFSGEHGSYILNDFDVDRD